MVDLNKLKYSYHEFYALTSDVSFASFDGGGASSNLEARQVGETIGTALAEALKSVTGSISVSVQEAGNLSNAVASGDSGLSSAIANFAKGLGETGERFGSILQVLIDGFKQYVENTLKAEAEAEKEASDISNEISKLFGDIGNNTHSNVSNSNSTSPSMPQPHMSYSDTGNTSFINESVHVPDGNVGSGYGTVGIK